MTGSGRTQPPDPPMLAPEIFRAYDIRGIVGRSLTREAVEWIGRAVGSEALDQGWTRVVVGRDGRLSSPDLAAALIRGLLATGVDVLDIGLVTTPMAYFAARVLDAHCAVMVTGSHNPVEYNGLKVVVGDQALAGEAVQALAQRIHTGSLRSGAGACHHVDVLDAYVDRIVGDVRLARPIRIAMDCGNGVAGMVAPRLFRALGCQVEELYCQVDGRFPHHHPDPSQPDNLVDLMHQVVGGAAEIGLAFDGDADRLGVVAKDGRVINPDRVLMLLADDVLARHPGATVLFDVKCTGALFGWIRARGGQPVLAPAGHSLMKAAMRRTGAMLAGEFSGHLFLMDRWYGFDDGVYAGARLLEYLTGREEGVACLATLPDSFNTPELRIAMPEGEAHRLVARLREGARFEGATQVFDMDGLRVEYGGGFGLVRASNTAPELMLRFEAESPAALEHIQQVFLRVLLEWGPAQLKSDLELSSFFTVNPGRQT